MLCACMTADSLLRKTSEAHAEAVALLRECWCCSPAQQQRRAHRLGSQRVLSEIHFRLPCCRGRSHHHQLLEVGHKRRIEPSGECHVGQGPYGQQHQLPLVLPSSCCDCICCMACVETRCWLDHLARTQRNSGACDAGLHEVLAWCGLQLDGAARRLSIRSVSKPVLAKPLSCQGRRVSAACLELHLAA